MGGVSEDVLLARAYLSRVAEPACIPLWRDVSRSGPVAVADAVRRGDVDTDTRSATVSRANTVDAQADLDAAERHGMRLLTPEDDEWPHVAMAALEAAGRRRLARYEAGDHAISPSGELIPPLALWVRGALPLNTLGFRSAALVGARACTAYGERVAKDLAYGLAERGFEIVSGGAHGIDATAHRAALAAEGRTVVVSAGGADSAYPPANRRLFDLAAESGLVVSESPPGSAPARRRFLTRNRLIATLSTGTVVVEAAARSGAMNTARHCRGLGRVLMAVPGPVTSVMSAGCHALLRADQSDPAAIVGSVDEVVDRIGSSSDVSGSEPVAALPRPHDLLDPAASQVLDGIPARGAISLDRLLITSGLPVHRVLGSLPLLEARGLVRRCDDGRYRLVRAATGGHAS